MHLDQSGTVIADKYELIEVAGRGGMAAVWRAVTRGAEGFRRAVAVKRVLPELCADKTFIDMFIEEARVGSQLQHPNIVQIHDFGRDQWGQYFLVMEWVEGLDLWRHVEAQIERGRRTSWPLLAAITIEVLRALAAAHERPQGQVIHRDVNPQNILIAESGVVKLSDFGLSRAMDRGRITHPDIVKGKLSYLAPELTYGADPTVRSDLFSVGIVLWEALAGRKLFQGDTDIDVLVGVREAEIPPLQVDRPGLPAPLYALIDRALKREPNERFSSADRMGRALADLLRGFHERTDARAVGRSVIEARARLAGEQVAPPPVPPPSGEVATVDGDGTK